ncbi:MAG: type II restriction endonuclease [Opitutales bacterium]|nr:type II restriction endonuclease [Opitutales bacterium]
MEKIPFDEFWNTLTETNTTLGFFVDFKKVTKNVESLAIRLNQLNYLLGKENLEEAVHKLFEENPRAFDVSLFEMLVAVRSKGKQMVLDNKRNLRNFSEFFTSADGVWDFITGTGLSEIFRDKKISNLVDYVFGVEVGLDSNARKSRCGKLMAEQIKKRFRDANIDFETEVNSTEFPDLTRLGKDMKRFDFVVKTSAKTYLIEVNFYNASGSKPNEVARAYRELAKEILPCENYEFVWITDGRGWRASQNKLKEAYQEIPNVFNLSTLEKFIENLRTEKL